MAPRWRVRQLVAMCFMAGCAEAKRKFNISRNLDSVRQRRFDSVTCLSEIMLKGANRRKIVTAKVKWLFSFPAGASWSGFFIFGKLVTFVYFCSMKKGQKPPPDPVDLIPEKIISTLMKSTGLDRKGVFAKMAELQVELDKLKNRRHHLWNTTFSGI